MSAPADTGPPSPERMRSAMARMPTPVTVVSTFAGPDPAGATTGAVASLSLDPPLVVACLDHGSRTLGALREHGSFAVNVLASGQADLARRFASKASPPEKWDGVSWSERAASPWIEGVALALFCRLEAEHPGGDHAIVVGRVLELEQGEAPSLVFHAGELAELS